MSLIDNMMESFAIVNKTKISDGEGGFTTTWTNGATFLCALTNDTSLSARIADHEGVTSTYTVSTKKNVELEYHDVIRRMSDGKTFRITSDPNDKKSPSNIATQLDIKQATAERWELTT